MGKIKKTTGIIMETSDLPAALRTLFLSASRAFLA
jgi:hypothetical protein